MGCTSGVGARHTRPLSGREYNGLAVVILLLMRGVPPEIELLVAASSAELAGGPVHLRIGTGHRFRSVATELIIVSVPQGPLALGLVGWPVIPPQAPSSFPVSDSFFGEPDDTRRGTREGVGQSVFYKREPSSSCSTTSTDRES